MEGFRLLRGYNVKTTYNNGLKVTLYEVGNNKMNLTLSYYGLPNLYERKDVIDMVGTFREYEMYADLIVRMHKLNPEMGHWEIRLYMEELFDNFVT
jgi:hypothetical protein